MLQVAASPYPAYFENYIKLVEADSVSEAAEKYTKTILDFFENIPIEKISYRYAEKKWNLKEMLQHIVDTERIFAYRALRIARNDKTPLPGFDENAFANASNADARVWANLLEEFAVVRRSTDFLLQNLSEEQLNQVGITNENPTSAKAIGFVVYGHILHHINIIKERYL